MKGHHIKEKLIATIKSIVMTRKYDDGTYSYYLRVPVKIRSDLLLRFRMRNDPIIDNKIVFDNYMGSGFGCNPKYVALKLNELYPGKYDMVWLVSQFTRGKSDFPPWIRQVDYDSEEAIEELITAKVWVSNYHKIAFTRQGLYKRSNQVFIQLWHGSLGIKKIEADASTLVDDRKWLKQAKISSEMVDYWISNSDFESDVYRNAFWNVTDSKIKLFGHPRNDLFFTETSEVRSKVRKKYGLSDEKVFFYAPTFREDYRTDCYYSDYQRLIEVLEEKFGGNWVIFLRLHPRVRHLACEIITNYDCVIDVTDYADIQELLTSSDAMMTDYSSCIFDYMLSKRPAFIFANDIAEYNLERGFYYPLKDTPFPIAKNNREIVEIIKKFDAEKYIREVNRFLKGKGCIEDGKASERVIELVARLTDESKPYVPEHYVKHYQKCEGNTYEG